LLDLERSYLIYFVSTVEGFNQVKAVVVQANQVGALPTQSCSAALIICLYVDPIIWQSLAIDWQLIYAVVRR
jgi:hypothetical protein